MSEYFEIAYAVAARRLCLFTGTGFSKSLTDNQAPGWQELLESICAKNLDDDKIKASLFPTDGKNPLQLDEAAQVIDLALLAKDKSIKNEIVSELSELTVSDTMKYVSAFFSKRSFRVITTNYDKISEELAENDCQSLCPGLPVPRSNSRVKVFHVHGSVDIPERMVVTSNDYFEFMDSESYFSKKMSTVLHENTVVILGYSLGDTNLKAILSNYGGFLRNHSVSGSIFFVSRTPVEQPIADYYATCFGIRVIDDTEIEEFFENIENDYDRAAKALDRSLKDLSKVLSGKATFKDSFIKLDDSFFQIVSAIGAAGHSLESKEVVSLFGEVIEQKKKLCGENGAWDQYTHLASWLAHLGALIEISDRSIEELYLEAVKYSMERMSKRQLLGYSWHAYQRWDAKWKSIHASNRILIRKYIETNSGDGDALSIVARQ